MSTADTNRMGGTIGEVGFRSTNAGGGTARRVHSRRDCEHIVDIPDSEIKERSDPTAVWPDWVPRCEDCYTPDGEPILDTYAHRDYGWMIHAYVIEGLSMARIASMIDVHPSSVAYWIERHGIARRG